MTGMELDFSSPIKLPQTNNFGKESMEPLKFVSQPEPTCFVDAAQTTYWGSLDAAVYG